MMNFLLNSRIIKMIVSKWIQKMLEKNGVSINIEVEELEIKGIEEMEYFNVKLKGNISDREILRLVNNGL